MMHWVHELQRCNTRRFTFGNYRYCYTNKEFGKYRLYFRPLLSASECRLFLSSLYTSLKRVRFFSILQTHYGYLCQQCNQSEHLSLARQKTCPPRGLCETLNFTTLANAPLLQSDIGIITELLR